MIAPCDRAYSTTTVSTSCTYGDCANCTMDCTIIVVDATPTRTRDEELWDELVHSLTYLPDPVEEYPYPFPEPICIETIRFWRKTQKKSRFRNIFEHKPFIKRRMPFSKSGWLARKGRLRKRGKK